MIVLNVTYHCKPGLREAFLERILAEGVDAASRAEAGNVKYDYYLPFDDRADELLLVEKWRDAAALDRHHGLPHFLRLSAFKGEYVTDTRAERFEV